MIDVKSYFQKEKKTKKEKRKKRKLNLLVDSSYQLELQPYLLDLVLM